MPNIRSMLVTGAAVAAAAVGGGAIANAASSSTATASAPSSSTSAPASARSNVPGHGTAAHEGAEKPVTGNAATKAKAAAVKCLGGGTAGEVTTDYTGSGYEVDVTKNGTTTEVHLDTSFTVQGGPNSIHGSARCRAVKRFRRAPGRWLARRRVPRDGAGAAPRIDLITPARLRHVGGLR